MHTCLLLAPHDVLHMLYCCAHKGKHLVASDGDADQQDELNRTCKVISVIMVIRVLKPSLLTWVVKKKQTEGRGEEAVWYATVGR